MGKKERTRLIKLVVSLSEQLGVTVPNKRSGGEALWKKRADKLTKKLKKRDEEQEEEEEDFGIADLFSGVSELSRKVSADRLRILIQQASKKVQAIPLINSRSTKIELATELARLSKISNSITNLAAAEEKSIADIRNNEERELMDLFDNPAQSILNRTEVLLPTLSDDRIADHIELWEAGDPLPRYHVIVRMGDEHRVLTATGLRGIKSNRDDEIFDLQGSDADFNEAFVLHDREDGFGISLIAVPTKARKTGQWFPYYNRTPMDLTRYDIHVGLLQLLQVYENEGNCLFKALVNSGEDEYETKEVMKYCNLGSVSTVSLKAIAELRNFMVKLIVLTKTDGKYVAKTRYYNKVDGVRRTIHLGLCEGHYFLIEKTIYTVYYVSNWMDMGDIEDAENVVGFKDGKPIRKNRLDEKMRSDKLIVRLLEEGKHFEKIPIDHIMMLPRRQKIKDIGLASLEGLDELNCLPIIARTEEGGYKRGRSVYDTFKEYVDSFAVVEDDKRGPVVHFDFETSTRRRADDAEEDEIEFHEPYMLCYCIVDQGVVNPIRTINGDDCGRKFLNALHKYEPIGYVAEYYDIKSKYSKAIKARPSRLLNPCKYENGADPKYSKEIKASPPRLINHAAIKKNGKLINRKKFTLYAHNLRYDVQFLVRHMQVRSEMSTGTKTKALEGNFFGTELRFKDSYVLIAKKLSDFPKMFGLDNCDKEIMPYNAYHTENLRKKRITMTEAEDKITIIKSLNYKEYMKLIKKYPSAKYRDRKERVKFANKMQKEEFRKLAESCGAIVQEITYVQLIHHIPLAVDLDLIDLGEDSEDEDEYEEEVKGEDMLDLMKYSEFYCKRDVEILMKGMEKFREWMGSITKIDIDNMVSIPQLIHQYAINSKVYDGCYKVNGIVREFIQMTIVGGRVMCRNNKMQRVLKALQDFDAVSLYPSAMFRMGGCPMGKPKLIKDFDSILHKKDVSYFIKCKIGKIHKKRSFPNLSRFNGESRDFSNNIEGDIMYLNNIDVQDLLKFQGANVEFIEGIYFDGGINKRMGPFIQGIFNERLKAKKELNPIQECFKLLMNSMYGKTIQKAIETKFIYKSDTIREGAKDKEGELETMSDFAKYLSLNQHIIESYSYIKRSWGTLVRIKVRKPVIDHYSLVHIGSLILSMSKRIMSEVMCLAEDFGINIYYQDTDSMHIDADKINDLSILYYGLYGRDLIGKNMGQFHSDFDFKSHKSYPPISTQLIAISKKLYCDKIRVVDPEWDGKGEVPYEYTYHCRAKGTPSRAILDYCHEKDMTPIDMYQNIYDGDSISLELKDYCLFQVHANFRTSNTKSFVRTICSKETRKLNKELKKKRKKN